MREGERGRKDISTNMRERERERGDDPQVNKFGCNWTRRWAGVIMSTLCDAWRGEARGDVCEF